MVVILGPLPIFLGPYAALLSGTEALAWVFAYNCMPWHALLYDMPWHLNPQGSVWPGSSTISSGVKRGCTTHFGETLRLEHDLNTAQFEFLRYLRDHPESRVADMAAYFAAGIGAVSKMFDRLEASGHAVRLPNPNDKRSALISLTPIGSALADAAEVSFTNGLHELVSSTLSDEHVKAAGAALATLRGALEAARLGLPVG